MTALPCLLDCDPGADDALAILWMLAHPERFAPQAITTVAGNMGLERTAANARRLLDLCELGARIPVHAGAHRPLMRATGKRSAMHGEDGLGDIGLPAPAGPPAKAHAVDAIRQAVRQNAGPLHLIATGPLTNLALALLMEPDLAQGISAITLMGGAAFCPGNTTPLAEFNFHVDPHAAQIVFDSGIAITMAGLDVTRDAVLTEAEVAHVAALDAAPAQAAAALLRSYGAKDPHLHDPVVIAWLLMPEIFAGGPAHVSIDTRDGPGAGQSITAASPRHLAGRSPNAHVLTQMNRARFAEGFIAAMERF